MVAHSVFSPSAASRWVHCPGSLEDAHLFPNRTSAAAEEGTAAHALLEHCLSEGLDPMDAHLEEHQYKGYPVTYEMAETVGKCVSGVRDLLHREPYELTTEERVYVPEVADDCFGTLDCSIFSERKKHLFILDFKYGRGTYVTSRENWQLITYAIGKISELEALGYEVSRVSLVICQPRHPDHSNTFDIWETDRAALKRYAKQLRKAASDLTVYKAGNWCKYCPKKAGCPTLEAAVDEVVEEASATLDECLTRAADGNRIAAILDSESMVKAYFAGLKEQAWSLLKLGESVPGYRLREQLGHREFEDVKAAEKVLHERFGDVIYEPRTLLSPAQMDKIKGAKPHVKLLTVRKLRGEVLEKEDKKDE